MRICAFVIAASLVGVGPAVADVRQGRLEIREEDGSPSVFPYQIKFTNGAVTDNADGTASINIAAASAPTNAQYVTLATNATLTAERVLTGTSNQITVTDNGAGSTVVLSTPQNLHTAATPTFAGLTITGANANTLLQTTGADQFGTHTEANSLWYFKNDTDSAYYFLVGGNHTMYYGTSGGSDSLVPSHVFKSSTGGDGAISLPTNSIGVAELDFANSPTDGQSATYQASTGRLLWASGGGSGITGLTADSGGTTSGSTVTLAGGTSLTTSRSSDTITISAPQSIATSATPTFVDLRLAGTGPDMRVTPTGGDAIHFGAETTGGATIGLISNATDGVPYLEFENTHVINLGSSSVPGVRVRTDGTGDGELTVPANSICLGGDGCTQEVTGTLPSANGGVSDIQVRLKNSPASYSQSITDATITALTFNDEDYDTDGMHDLVSNTTRITFVRAGKYEIGCDYVIDGGTDAQGTLGYIRINGSTIIARFGFSAVGTAAFDFYPSGVTTYNATASDYAECTAYADKISNGASAVTLNHFWARKEP